MKLAEIKCKNCGAQLKIEKDNDKITCEFCNSTFLVEDLVKKKPNDKEILHKKNPLLYVIILIILLSIVVSIYSFTKIAKNEIVEINNETVEVFDFLDVKFDGNNGNGKVNVTMKENKYNMILSDIYMDISQTRGLFNDDKIKISVYSSKYHLNTSEKVYTVSGLDEYLRDVSNLTDEDIELIKKAANTNMEKARKGLKKTTSIKDQELAKIYLLSDGEKTNLLYYVEKDVFKTDKGVLETAYVVVYFKNAIIYHGENPRFDYYSSSYTGSYLPIDNNKGGYISGFKNLDDVKQSLYKGQSNSMKYSEK